MTPLLITFGLIFIAWAATEETTAKLLYKKEIQQIIEDLK